MLTGRLIGFKAKISETMHFDMINIRSLAPIQDYANEFTPCYLATPDHSPTNISPVTITRVLGESTLEEIIPFDT